MYYIYIHIYIYIYICITYIYIYIDIYIYFKGDNHCLPQHIGDEFSWVIIITLIVLGKP